MKSKIELLNTIFNHISPFELFKYGVQGHECQDFTNIDYLKQVTKKKLYSFYREYSYDDVDVKVGILDQPLCNNIFKVLENLANEMLKMDLNGDLECRFDEIINLTNLTNKLDQEILINSFIVGQDLKLGREQERKYQDLKWKSIIATDDHGLKGILSKGYCENHFHLGGSSLNFQLSWLGVMNDLGQLKFMDKKFENSLRNQQFQGDNRTNIEEELKLAYVIRVFLYLNIGQMDEEFSLTNDLNINDGDDKCYSKENLINKFKLNIDSIDQSVVDANEIIKFLRIKNIFNLSVVGTEANKVCNQDYLNKSIDDDLDDFSGERWLNYKVLYKILSEPDQMVLRNYYFIYLNIKSRFRSEVIQGNDRFGFMNFKNYQERKSKFIKSEDSIIKYATLRTIREQEYIQELELRIMPQFDVGKLKYIFDFTEGKGHFVFHIPKSSDKYIEKTENQHLNQPRNKKSRNEALQFVNKILRKMDDCDKLLEYVSGVDTCSNEIGCRPENFAYMYRTLKKYVPENTSTIFKLRKSKNQMRFTYHVGEDFLDPVDGLRAVYECINFLELGSGDRIGHAIVLGIDIQEWYRAKGYEVYLRSQDLLDNIVWLIKQSEHLNVELSSSFKNELFLKARKYYNEIYYEHTEYSFNIDDYYDSMYLRGDVPDLYLLQGKRYEFNEYRCDLSEKYKCTNALKSSSKIRDLDSVNITR